MDQTVRNLESCANDSKAFRNKEERKKFKEKGNTASQSPWRVQSTSSGGDVGTNLRGAGTRQHITLCPEMSKLLGAVNVISHCISTKQRQSGHLGTHRSDIRLKVQSTQGNSRSGLCKFDDVGTAHISLGRSQGTEGLNSVYIPTRSGTHCMACFRSLNCLPSMLTLPKARGVA